MVKSVYPLRIPLFSKSNDLASLQLVYVVVVVVGGGSGGGPGRLDLNTSIILYDNLYVLCSAMLCRGFGVNLCRK